MGRFSAVDFGSAADDYGQWRQGFPPEFFQRLDTHSLGVAGQRVLDIGTGTGLLARALALRGCQVTSLDPSPALLAEARSADEAAGVSIEYYPGRAEATGLEAGAYDVVSAATCWHWVNRLETAAECRRLLRRDGKLLIAHLDWLSFPGNVIDTTLEIINRFSLARTSRPMSFQYPG